MRKPTLLRKGDRVAFCLFEHNEKAYKSTIWMMEQYGKATTVHLTDTEKSYIEFKLIEDNPETAIIWLFCTQEQLDEIAAQKPA